MPPRTLGPALVFLLSVSRLLAVPTANPDGFQTGEDGVLTVGAAESILSNDTATGTLSATLESDVSNGSLSLNPDGTFTYTPDPNFNGTDSFTYRAVETPGAQVFTVDQNNSAADVDVSVTIAAGTPVIGGDTASDSTNTALKGTLTANVVPSESPFSQIHVTDFQVTTADAVSLHIGFTVLFIEVAGIDVDADPEGITIEMAQPGAPAAVDGAGNFSQLQNEVRVIGTVNVAGTGAAAGEVPDGPQNLDLTGEFIDLNGTITQAGNTLTLAFPVEFSGVFDLDGNTIDLDLSGDVVATSPVQTPEFSTPTTVTINVTPLNDPPTVLGEHYSVASDASLDIPVNLAGGGDQTLVATGATWKYLDDGSDQGTAWSTPGFVDAAWASGASPLGYGESEATTIGFGGDENAKFITSYFRHQFEVPDPEAHGSLTLMVLRDDGVAVYLNGTEVARSNLVAGAGPTTEADGAVGGPAEEHYFEFSLPTSLLVAGTNTIAAEVHQSAPTSSDLGFDLQLVRHRTGGGVLANDSDIDGDTLAAEVHRDPASGTLALANDGSFIYTPNPGFVGQDSFIYEAQDIDEFDQLAIIPFGDEWRYLDDGSDQGTAWRAPGFDDSGWASGPGELGYGETDRATTVGFGPDAETKFATTYFRNHFFFGNPGALSDDVFISLVRDDAAAIYLNGTEIYRDANLVNGALFSTYANPGVVDENEVVNVSVPLNLLVPGRNTIAAEIHQSSGTSSDLAFDLTLICETPAVGPILPMGSDWKYDDSGADLGTAWTAPGFDDSLWLSGAGEIGYGDGDEATPPPGSRRSETDHGLLPAHAERPRRLPGTDLDHRPGARRWDRRLHQRHRGRARQPCSRCRVRHAGHQHGQQRERVPRAPVYEGRSDPAAGWRKRHRGRGAPGLRHEQ